MMRLLRGPILLIAASIIALLIALAFGGGADAPLLLDPGAATRYGLPISKMFVNLASAMTIGALVLACLALPSTSAAFAKALDVSSISAAVWTVAAGATGFFSFVSAYNQPVTFDATFGNIFGMFLTASELGQAWLATVLVAAMLTVACFAVRNVTVIALLTAVAVAGLVPMSLQGHQGGTADHDSATMAVFLHVLFAGIWLGGLVTVVIVHRTLDRSAFVVVLRRYSTIALISFLVVAASGYLSAQTRVDGWQNLASPYGVLVIVKVIALLAMGGLGAIWRRTAIARAGASGRWFWGLVVSEIIFMGIASGVAAALARTATPVPEFVPSIPTPADILTGRPLPPPPSVTNYFTLWNFDLLWILVCAFAIFFYLAGVMRLKRRGDRWPWYRTALWIAGIGLLFYITNGGINLYQKYLFSSHMLGHMALGMVVPILLVPAAPITLALRTITKRTDGSRGPREWIMLVVHSKLFEILGNPLVAAGLFVGSLWAFYYSPLFDWATSNHIGHQWMIVHFLLTGYLFVQSLIGVDPSPNRAPYPIRLLTLLATMAFHAFFGLALLSGTALLLPDWYGAMGWPAIDALADQQAAGGIAWSVGEIPTVALAIIVVFLWSRSDGRESKRYDRQADRDGDAELEEYNRMLSARAAAAILTSPKLPGRRDE